MEIIELSSPHGHARLSLQGAQLLESQLNGRPLTWLSPYAHLNDAKQTSFDSNSLFRKDAIRGGVPVCFPWFGQRPGLPSHGFARNRSWRLCEQSASHAVLSLTHDDESLVLWPHRFRAELTVRLDDGVNFGFRVDNVDDVPFAFTYALHSYLATPDVDAAHVEGLDGRLRREVGHVTTPQQGAVRLDRYIDAVFDHAAGRLTLIDALGGVQVDEEGMDSAVIWNPHDGAIPDVGDQWPRFICVERGHVGTSSITLAPGEQHVASMRLSLPN